MRSAPLGQHTYTRVPLNDTALRAFEPVISNTEECKAVLARSSFGHLAFARNGHVEAIPIRYVFVDRWLYFRAPAVLRAAMAQNAWVAVTVGENVDATHVTSVIARGACHPALGNGSAIEDDKALRDILRLRDPSADSADREARFERTSIVYRVHVDQLRREVTYVPQLAPFDASLVARTRASRTS